jgi:hypothetical protein
MSDDVPDFLPGPDGPEDDRPGPRVTLSVDQLRAVAALAADTPDGRAVVIEDRGAACVEATMLAAAGQPIGDPSLIPNPPDPA